MNKNLNHKGASKRKGAAESKELTEDGPAIDVADKGMAKKKGAAQYVGSEERKQHVKEGKMREDFFYRVHIIPIHLPPLRNRKDDIPFSGPSGNANSFSYVQPHQDIAGSNVVAASATFDDRVRGIEAGSLYPYVNDHKLYHCPGDQRFQGVHHNYLSYAMPFTLGGSVKKATKISMPQESYIFVEESDTRAYMMGGWSLGIREIGLDGWWDGLAVWHNGSSTFGFGDGHADRHKWINETTIERANRDLSDGGAYGYQAYVSGPREDLDWQQQHWPHAQ